MHDDKSCSDAPFSTPERVVAALRRYRDVFDPATASLIMVSRSRFDSSRSPFHGRFLHQVDEREELRRRMAERIPPRERKLLFLWYVADLPVVKVAQTMGISRMHCYRLRKDALRALCDEETGPADGGSSPAGGGPDSSGSRAPSSHGPPSPDDQEALVLARDLLAAPGSVTALDGAGHEEALSEEAVGAS